MGRIKKVAFGIISKAALTNAGKEVNWTCVLLDISRKCETEDKKKSKLKVKIKSYRR